jgi:uncharacterized protein (DUF58 family)
MAPLFTRTDITFRRLVQYGLLLCFGVGFVLYVLFQARFLTAGPTLTLEQNLPNPQAERVVTLSGTARNIVSMTLNGRAVFTDASGYFREDVILENGYTIVTLKAEDRYGRVRTYSREFVYNQNAGAQ